MVNGALCFHHVHKFLLAYCALNLNLRRQHPTCLYFHTRSLLLSHPFNFNHSATPFKPSLLRIPNSRLFSLSCGGSGGNDARGGGCGSNGPNSGGSGGSNCAGGNGGHKWSFLFQLFWLYFIIVSKCMI
ncbi:hypothetical protein VIGAN_02052200 [Vigna angularis var. angularis]|uniref:Uncharacterized protein n=1 Tax=Vigna angularis var. angularis TaxID=157739 RepID=A0A0S3RBX8_PHAAN|nr:hypothetical protein VIGAN_02052200 [Vigna angularis var. angularis]